MFERTTDYPTAVASDDDEGIAQAIRWCADLMWGGDTFFVWTHLKSNLRNCAALERLVMRSADVAHITGRGSGGLHGSGPVLMAWPDVDDIGKLTKYGSHGVRGLCVINWTADRIRPWVLATKPTILGDDSEWSSNDDSAVQLDSVVVEALKDVTLSINHNNTIAAGYEKDDVVGMLLALRDARVPMDAAAMQAWALANGWTGSNPQKLADYVTQINAGKRPRISRRVDARYIEHLRRRMAGETD